MPKLIIQRDGVSVAEIPLKAGSYRIGRDDTNEIQINDESISNVHCELQVEEHRTIIRDLESTTGTYINGEPVIEGTLVPGQLLKLGDVDILYAGEQRPAPVPKADARQSGRIRVVRNAGASSGVAPAPVETAPVEAPAASLEAETVAGPDDCFNHPGVPYQFVCRRCGRRLCSACVRSYRAGLARLHSCSNCEGVCLTRNEQSRLEEKRDLTMARAVPQAFTYPFRGNGPVILLGATLLLSFVNGASSLPFLGLLGAVGLVVTVLITGYLTAYYKSIIASSAQGEESLPNWPDLSDAWNDVIAPFLQFAVVWIVCLGPGFLLIRSGEVSNAIAIPVFLFGLFCLPMTLLAVAMADSFSGLNPIVIFSSIAKIPGPYLVACLVLLLLVGLQLGLEYALNFVRIPILSTALLTFLGLYGVMVQMRLIGLLYYIYEPKLAWFRR